MSDVAAVLSQMEHEDICMSEPPLPDHEAGDMYRPCSLGAMRLKAATPAGQALAADLALAAAIGRLPANVTIQHTASGRWRVYMHDHEPMVPVDWQVAQGADSLVDAATRIIDVHPSHMPSKPAAALEGDR